MERQVDVRTPMIEMITSAGQNESANGIRKNRSISARIRIE